jgi:hypothetical protein
MVYFELAMVQMNYNNLGEKPPERYEGGGKLSVTVC